MHRSHARSRPPLSAPSHPDYSGLGFGAAIEVAFVSIGTATCLTEMNGRRYVDADAET
jgi:hypothetical protein